MSTTGSPLADAIQADLRSACAHLLDAGATARRDGDGVAAIGPLGHVLSTVQDLAHLLGPALDELEGRHRGRSEVLALSPIPKRARAPRRPQDYLRRGSGLVPRVWEVRRGLREPSHRILAWLLHGIECLEERIQEQRIGHDMRFDEAARFRGGSRYGRAEVEHLEQQSRALRQGEEACRRWKRGVASRAGVPLPASPRMPRPFPNTPTWRRLRALVFGLENPETVLPRRLAQDLLREARPADLPYLYERWCGWRVLQGLESLGWLAAEDPIPTLLYGGRVHLRRGTARLRLLCSPRFVAGKDPIEGIVPRYGEASPDFVLLVEGERGVEATVLDPTLSVDQASREAKWAYLETLQLLETRRVAGVVTRKAPLRSWAAAPMIHGTCMDVDWRGSRGTIPMNPCAFESRPLLDWLGEVLPDPPPPGIPGDPTTGAAIVAPTEAPTG